MQLPIQERPLHLYEHSAQAMDGLAPVREKMGDLKTRLSDDKTKRWIVTFNSPVPTIWNTDTSRRAVAFAEPLSRTPPEVRYVQFRRFLNESVIIPISHAELGKTVIRHRFG